jgi:hypothetical protein
MLCNNCNRTLVVGTDVYGTNAHNQNVCMACIFSGNYRHTLPGPFKLIRFPEDVTTMFKPQVQLATITSPLQIPNSSVNIRPVKSVTQAITLPINVGQDILPVNIPTKSVPPMLFKPVAMTIPTMPKPVVATISTVHTPVTITIPVIQPTSPLLVVTRHVSPVPLPAATSISNDDKLVYYTYGRDKDFYDDATLTDDRGRMAFEDISFVRPNRRYPVQRSNDGYYWAAADIWLGDIGLWGISEDSGYVSGDTIALSDDNPLKGMYPHRYLVAKGADSHDDNETIIKSGKATSLTYKDAIAFISDHKKLGYRIVSASLKNDVDFSRWKVEHPTQQASEVTLISELAQ